MEDQGQGTYDSEQYAVGIEGRRASPVVLQRGMQRDDLECVKLKKLPADLFQPLTLPVNKNL